jgi:hypothetical protein
MTYRTPAELVMALRRERGAELGPSPLGYADNRSLEAPDGSANDFPEMMPPPPIDPDQLPPPPPRLPFAELHEVPPAAPLAGDFVHLGGNRARIGKFECTINDKEAKAIRTIVVKAIRRELRDMEKE